MMKKPGRAESEKRKTLCLRFREKKERRRRDEGDEVVQAPPPAKHIDGGVPGPRLHS